jgi:hypothetical protein
MWHLPMMWKRRKSLRQKQKTNIEHVSFYLFLSTAWCGLAHLEQIRYKLRIGGYIA